MSERKICRFEKIGVGLEEWRKEVAEAGEDEVEKHAVQVSFMPRSTS
jgi:hypothetical protein